MRRSHAWTMLVLGAMATGSFGCSSRARVPEIARTGSEVQRLMTSAWEADRSGDRMAALNLYTQAYQKDPNNAWAKLRLEQLSGTSATSPETGTMLAQSTPKTAKPDVAPPIPNIVSPESESAPQWEREQKIAQVAAEESTRISTQVAEFESLANAFEDAANQVEDTPTSPAIPKAAAAKTVSDKKTQLLAAIETNPFEDDSPSREDFEAIAAKPIVELGDDEIIAPGWEQEQSQPESNSYAFNPFEQPEPKEVAEETAARIELGSLSNGSEENPFSVTAEAFTDQHSRSQVEHVNGTSIKWTDKPVVQVAAPDSNIVVLDLIQLLSHSDPAVRRNAVGDLASMGQRASSAKTAIQMMLDDEDRYVQAEAAWAIWQIDNDATTAVNHLSSDVLSPNKELANFAVQSLGLIGKDAMKAKSVLIERLRHVTGADQVRTAEAILRIDPSDRHGQKIALAAAKFGNTTERAEATYALSHASPEPTVLAALIRSLQDDRESVRSAAVLALGTMGPTALPARRKLEEVARYDTVNVREAAKVALECIE